MSFSYSFASQYERKYNKKDMLVPCLTSQTYGVWDTLDSKWLEGYRINHIGIYCQYETLEALLKEGLKNISQNQYLSGKSILSVDQGAPNYCHLLVNILPDIIAAASCSKVDNLITGDNSEMLRQYLELLGIRLNIVPIRNKAVCAETCYFGETYPQTDISYNHSAMYLEIAARISAKVDAVDISYPKKVFIERKHSNNGSGLRNLYPQEILHEDLRNNGFTIVYLEDHSIVSQIRLFANAEIIAGVHGAALANIIYSRKTTRIIEFVHENGSPNCFMDLSRALSLERYEQVECQGFLSPRKEQELKEKTGNNSNNVCPLAYSEHVKSKIFADI
jgi:capsular polysaccharide biosynthesis protein